MEFKGAIAIVTGGGDGLGEGICRALADAGASGIVVADAAGDKAGRVADDVGGVGVTCDVGVESEVAGLVARCIERFGRVDVVFSNAGIALSTHPFSADEQFERMWRVHVMSIVYLARHTIPEMIERGRGGFVVTASTDGVATSTGDMAYAITKHGQVAAAEWLAMVYGSRGIDVCCFCPAWMWTGMTRSYQGREDVPDWLRLAMTTGISAREAADILLEGAAAGHFLVTTAAQTILDMRRKAADFDSWITALQQWHDLLQPQVGPST
jgi:NAD(P)-dependent dehydrogenase (short-subunit alcohol dehydrogenase family)